MLPIKRKAIHTTFVTSESARHRLRWKRGSFFNTSLHKAVSTEIEGSPKIRAPMRHPKMNSRMAKVESQKTAPQPNAAVMRISASTFSKDGKLNFRIRL